MLVKMFFFWFNVIVYVLNIFGNFSNVIFSLYDKVCDILDNFFFVKIMLILVFFIIMLFSLVGNVFIFVILY